MLYRNSILIALGLIFALSLAPQPVSAQPPAGDFWFDRAKAYAQKFWDYQVDYNDDYGWFEEPWPPDPPQSYEPQLPKYNHYYAHTTDRGTICDQNRLKWLITDDLYVGFVYGPGESPVTPPREELESEREE